jgi:hypothetical protein
MWIPHNLLSPLKAETPKPTIQASEAATEERTFVVGFFLRNPVTRAWETDVLVAPADSRREIQLDGRPCMVHASSNVSGKLHEIIYTFPAPGAVAALAAAFRHVEGELDRMALQYGRGLEIAGWRVADVEHGARWRCVPFRPSALMAEPDPGPLPPAYAEVLRLYREARTAPGAAWRLICAGAILDAAVSARTPFDATHVDLAGYAVSTDMLVRSGAFFACPEIRTATAGTLRDIVEPQRQKLLASVTTLGAGPVGDRDYNAEAALAALANLVDLVARDLVLASLRADGYLRAAAAVEEAEPASV